jgi:glycosyltransferase involved in cell wall biosynthesis
MSGNRVSKFGTSIRKRAGEALRKIDCRYFGAGVRLEIDAFAAKAVDCAASSVVLFVDHRLGGGANLYRRNWMRQADEEGRAVLLLTYDYPGRRYVFEFPGREGPHSIRLHSLDCVRRLVAGVGNIGEVVVNELVSFPDPLMFLDFLTVLKSGRGISLSILVHDYYCVCPGAHLLDRNGAYCGPSLDTGRCGACLTHLDLHIRKHLGAVYDIARWRSSWGRLLMECDSIVCFSDSSRGILRLVYPDLDMKRLVVRPHSRSPIEAALEAQRDVHPLRIGVPGKIDAGKGSGMLARMAAYAEAQGLPVYFIIIGSVTPPLVSRRVVVTGEYRHEDLYSLLSLFNIDIFLVPSVLPETFSYTAEEIMCAGYPLAVFDLGAPAERVRRYANGLVLSAVDPVAAVNELISFARTHASNL